MGDYTGNLPPGFRFFPSDEELIVHFLGQKTADPSCQPNIIPTLDLHQLDPWDLNGTALQGGNQLFYFFARNTQHRATPNGYWNPIGNDETIASIGDGKNVGIKKSLVFYFGEIKTNWIMHEYHLSDNAIVDSSSSRSSRRSSSKKSASSRIETSKWIICRAYDSTCGSQGSYHDGSVRELSCLDEVFLSLDDDLDEVSLPNR